MISLNSSLIKADLSQHYTDEVEKFLARGGTIKKQDIFKRTIEEITPNIREYVVNDKHGEGRTKPVHLKVKAKQDKAPSEEDLRVEFNRKAKQEALEIGLNDFEGKCRTHGLEIFVPYRGYHRCVQCASMAIEEKKKRRALVKSNKELTEEQVRKASNEEAKNIALSAGKKNFIGVCKSHGEVEYRIVIKKSGKHNVRCPLCVKEGNKQLVEKRKLKVFKDDERTVAMRLKKKSEKLLATEMAKCLGVSASTVAKVIRGEEHCGDKLWNKFNGVYGCGE